MASLPTPEEMESQQELVLIWSFIREFWPYIKKYMPKVLAPKTNEEEEDAIWDEMLEEANMVGSAYDHVLCKKLLITFLKYCEEREKKEKEERKGGEGAS